MAVPDNLKIGDFISVIAFRRRVRRSRPFGDGADEELEWDELDCSGEPLEILAISLPFLAVVGRSGDRGMIDVRNCRLAFSSRAVRKALDGQTAPKLAPGERRAQRREAAVAQRCGRCGGTMTQRLLRAGSGTWGLVCPECDGARKTAGPR